MTRTMDSSINRRRFLRISGQGLAAAALMGASACGRDTSSDDSAAPDSDNSGTPDSEELTADLRVYWWGAEDRHNAYREALDLFSEKNPGVQIASEFAGFDTYFDKLATQVATGSAPDVFQLSLAALPEYAGRNALLPLDDLVDVSLLDESVVETSRIDGTLYCVPMGVNAAMVFYDRTKLDELGISVPETWTWDEFGDFAQEVSEASGDGYWGTADGGGYRAVLDAWVRGHGAFFFGEDGGLGFDKDLLTAHFEYWSALRERGAVVSPDEQALFQDNLDGYPLIRGKTALDFSYSSILPGLNDLTPSDLGVEMIPFGPDGSGQSILMGVMLSASADSENPDAAGAVIDFMANDHEAAELIALTRGVPASEDLRSLLLPDVNEIEKAGFEFIDKVGANSTDAGPVIPPGGNEIQVDLLPRINERIAFGEASVSEAVDAFFEEAESLLQ